MKGLSFLKSSKNYIWFAFILFFTFSLLGFIFPSIFEEQILELISGIIEQTEGLGILELIGFIFLNNLRSSFLAMIFGMGFGIFPFLVILINGYVLGFVANKSVSSEGILILWRLLPHGIFEIPAVMISAGLGFKLGSYLFSKDKKKKFSEGVILSLKSFIFIIIPLLLIAAIIEGFLIYLF
jgi:stage II sporulation protein M